MTVPTPPPYYGATVDDVRLLLPHRTIDTTSAPSVAAVTGYLRDVAARVATRLGTVDAWAVDADTVVTAARGLVALGAAAYADDASYPERASTVGSSRYGAVLWERFTTGLAELEDDVAGDPGAGGGTVSPMAARTNLPAIRTAPPLFTRALGY